MAGIDDVAKTLVRKTQVSGRACDAALSHFERATNPFSLKLQRFLLECIAGHRRNCAHCAGMTGNQARGGPEVISSIGAQFISQSLISLLVKRAELVRRKKGPQLLDYCQKYPSGYFRIAGDFCHLGGPL